MKKLLSFFLTFIILLSCCVPAFAVDGSTTSSVSFEGAEALYSVSEKIYADAYMLINLDDDTYPVIAQKNADKQKFPASLTKIVTTMVTLNNVSDLSQKTTVSRAAIEALYGTDAQVAGLEIGEEATIEELLYLTMVHSACDACQVLAEYVGGTVENFCKMMNDWVESIGCKNTNFVNPDGLPDDNHYTTAQDMATITIEAMKNEMFNTISCTKSYEYKNMTLVHTNYMLDKFHTTYYYEYASGIKTGSTDSAGFCVITKASKNGYNYLAIVMDSPIENIDGYDTKCSFIDAKTLFEWAFNGLKYATVIRKNDVVSEVDVTNGKDADTVQLVAQDDVTTLVPTSLDPSAVVIEAVDAPNEIDAPIAQGDVICSANIIYGDQVIATTNLVAGQSVELSTFLTIISGVKNFFKNKVVIAIIVLLILGFIGYVALFFARLQKNKKRTAQKRLRQQQLDEEMGGYSRKNDFDDLQPPKPPLR